MRPTTTHWIAPVLALLLVAAPSAAEVYSCTGQDGNVSYQQTPCPAAPVAPQPVAQTTAAGESCAATRRLAFSTARLAHSGMDANEVRGAYGGVGSLSPGALAVIDFVYAKDAPDTSAEQMAALAEFACAAGTLIGPACPDLPAGIAGCNENRPASQQPARLAPPTAGGTQGENVRACREPFEQEIEAIDQRLLAGDTSMSPAAYRDRLMELTAELRACAAAAEPR